MIDLRQLRAFVIKPALTELGLWSQAAEELLIGTGLVESGFVHLRQLPDGPALGFWQMEPATEHDLWGSYLLYRPSLASVVFATLSGDKPSCNGWVSRFLEGWRPDERQMMVNLDYAVMLARLLYRRVPKPLPAADDVEGLARYWKKSWNTKLGRGNPATFVLLYREHVRKENS